MSKPQRFIRLLDHRCSSASLLKLRMHVSKRIRNPLPPTIFSFSQTAALVLDVRAREGLPAPKLKMVRTADLGDIEKMEV